MEIDRRRYPRISCDGVATLDLGGDAPCLAHLLDLSVEGCHLLFDSPQSIQRDEEVLMTFEVGNVPFDVRARAKSIRSDTSVGVYFTELTENGRADLESLLGMMAEGERLPGANRMPWEPMPTTH
jgi:hypothetical protein